MKRKINYKNIAICFMILLMIFGIVLVIKGNESYEEISAQAFCSKIRYTPAWVKDNQILGYGYKDLKELPEGVIFYYQTGCPACHKQIELFGEYFKELEEEGRAIDCAVN